MLFKGLSAITFDLYAVNCAVHFVIEFFCFHEIQLQNVFVSKIIHKILCYIVLYCVILCYFENHILLRHHTHI